MESGKYLKESISIIHLILVLLRSAYKSIKIDRRKFVIEIRKKKITPSTGTARWENEYAFMLIGKIFHKVPLT